MTKPDGSFQSNENQLIARLPKPERDQLLGLLRRVPLEFGQTLYEVRGTVDYVYFPVSGVLSFITVMNDGRGIEVATVGNEGMLGVTSFLEAGKSPHRVIAQVPGEALRMPAREMEEFLLHSQSFRKIMTLYQTAFILQISQSVACNGLHQVNKRCCRWLLMTHDRVDSDVLPLTHEFLSMMLGVRRPGVTEVLQQLQELGLIKTRRGTITILDREGLEKQCCECYRILNDEFQRILGSK